MSTSVPSSHDGHVRPAATTAAGRVPISGQTDATRPGDNTPRIIHATGAVSHAGPSDQHPHHRGHEEGNGQAPVAIGRLGSVIHSLQLPT